MMPAQLPDPPDDAVPGDAVPGDAVLGDGAPGAGAHRRLAIGIAGGGFMGRVHARAALVNGARLVGVSSSSEAHAQRAARMFRAERAFGDSKELVTDPEIDVVHICTPNHLHAELVELALSAGKHVICEKPLATTTETATALTRLAAQTRRVAAVPFVYRYYPMVHEARWRIRRGDLGRLSLVHGHYLQDWLLGPGETNWRVDSRTGGPSRAFADIGSHWCDLVEFVTGTTIDAVAAQTRIVEPRRRKPNSVVTTPDGDAGRDFAVDTEDTVVVQFRTTTDVVGTVAISQNAAGHVNDLQLEVLGNAGALAFRQSDADALWIASSDSVPKRLARDAERLLSPDAASLSRLPAGHPQGYQDCVDAFIGDVYRAVVDGAAPERMPTFGDAARMAALTEAVLASAATGGSWITPTVPAD